MVGTHRIATLHRRLAQYGQRFLPITELESPVELPPMVQAMQWHKYRSKDPALVWLRGLMAQAVGVMDANIHTH